VRWARHVAHILEICTEILVGEPERNRPLGRSRRRWNKNNVEETVCDVVYSRSGTVVDSRYYGDDFRVT